MCHLPVERKFQSVKVVRESTCVFCVHNRFSERWTPRVWRKKSRIIQSLQFGTVNAEQLVCIHYVQNLKLKIDAFSSFISCVRKDPESYLMKRKIAGDEKTIKEWQDEEGGVCFPLHCFLSCMTQNQCNETCWAVLADPQHRLDGFWWCKLGRIWCKLEWLQLLWS